eukprot:15440434-Alexandrium_andersonii.AAC.1
MQATRSANIAPKGFAGIDIERTLVGFPSPGANWPAALTVDPASSMFASGSLAAAHHHGLARPRRRPGCLRKAPP